jgi:hypothetical protein
VHACLTGTSRAVEEWFDLILRDFRDTPVTAHGVELINMDADVADDVADRVPDIAQWLSKRDPAGILLRVGGNVTRIDDTDDGPSGMAVHIAYAAIWGSVGFHAER